MADAMEGLTPEEKAAFEEAEQKTRERYELACKVVDLAEGLVVSDSHFLAPRIASSQSVDDAAGKGRSAAAGRSCITVIHGCPESPACRCGFKTIACAMLPPITA